MKERFLKYINDNSLVNQGDMVLLAVSGGIDSMVMATLFNDAGFSTGIAHCNFGLRDKESDMDEDLVKQFAEEINIPCFTVRFDTPEYARKYGISIQMAARELRYNWFEKIRSENGFD